MDNVALLKNEPEVDITAEQSTLNEAEDASLKALEQCSNLGAAFASFMRKTKYSILHPKARVMMKRYPHMIEKIVGVSDDLCEFHKLAHSMAEKSSAGNIVMSGGLPKDEHFRHSKDQG
ncbi:MAG: hypothetical protein AAFX54_17895 [Pseudomonadota bacterium]